jgi:hypothetical protein
MSKPLLQAALLQVFVILAALEAHADGCPTTKDEIATDRPDVTNSSLVAPTVHSIGENYGDSALNWHGSKAVHEHYRGIKCTVTVIPNPKHSTRN